MPTTKKRRSLRRTHRKSAQRGSENRRNARNEKKEGFMEKIGDVLE